MSSRLDFAALGRGDGSAVLVPPLNPSRPGVSPSEEGANALRGPSSEGSAGSDLSTSDRSWLVLTAACLAARDFFLRRAMSDS